MTRTTIIAEAGVNHNGSTALAKKLIDAAADAGADYVKFQTFVAEENIACGAAKAEYQKVNTGDEVESQLEMVKKLELRFDDHAELVAHAERRGIKFASTAFDPASIKLLEGLDVDFLKVPSGEITNLPYLRRIGSTGKPLVVSTGMCTMDEIGAALEALVASGAPKDRMCVLHCNTQYPTPMGDVHLRAMRTIGEAFDVEIGYSDHTLGIEVPIAAVALGATVIEKHFTLDRTMEGPDHAASLEPDELKAMVRAIRNIEAALGKPHKVPSPSETPNIEVARKSIVAACPISKGERLSEANLAVKRPGNGISPMLWDSVLGTPASRDYGADELIERA